MQKILRNNDSRLVRRQLKSKNIKQWNKENKIVNYEDKGEKEELTAVIKSAVSNEYQEELLSGKITLDSEITVKIRKFIINYLNDNGYAFTNPEHQTLFINEFITNFSGYGVLQTLIDDETIEEIYVLGYDKVYINKNGEKILTDIKFRNKEHLKTFLDNILAVINRRVDAMQPIEDAHLPDYNRVAVSGDVISPQGFTFNIRKFRKEKLTFDHLVNNKTLTPKVKDILIDVVNAKMNTIISGGTASGKTTLLNACADYFSDNEFIVSIEDNLELQLGKDFALQLETRKTNIEGRGEITMADEFKHILRRSPGRIAIGEIRDGKVATVFMQAANTGHDGCIATVHANSPEMCRNRISKLISDESGQTIESCTVDFNQAIEIIVQIAILPKEHRRVISNVAFVGYNGEIFDWVKYNSTSNTWDVNNDLPKELMERLARYGG